MGNSTIKSVVYEYFLIEFVTYYGPPNAFGHRKYGLNLQFIDLNTLSYVLNKNLEKFGVFSSFTILKDVLYMIFYENYGFILQKYDLKKHEMLKASEKLLPQTNLLQLVGFQEKSKVLQTIADEKNNKIYIISSHGFELSIHVFYLDHDKLENLTNIKVENDNIQFYYVQNQLIFASIQNKHLKLSKFNFKEKCFIPFDQFPLKESENFQSTFHPGFDKDQKLILVDCYSTTHVYDFQFKRFMTFNLENSGSCCGVKDGHLLFFLKQKEGGVSTDTMLTVSIPELKKLDVLSVQNHDLEFKFE
jgi:hypothetical protein